MASKTDLRNDQAALTALAAQGTKPVQREQGEALAREVRWLAVCVLCVCPLFSVCCVRCVCCMPWQSCKPRRQVGASAYFETSAKLNQNIAAPFEEVRLTSPSPVPHLIV